MFTNLANADDQDAAVELYEHIQKSFMYNKVPSKTVGGEKGTEGISERFEMVLQIIQRLRREHIQRLTKAKDARLFSGAGAEQPDAGTLEQSIVFNGTDMGMIIKAWR